MSKIPPSIEKLNSVTLDNITISDDGDVTVTWAMQGIGQDERYEVDTECSRTFDIYEDKELLEICQTLYKALRKKLETPDPERDQVSCDTCLSSACCREFNVLVSDSDLNRLAPASEQKSFIANYLTDAHDWTGEYKYMLEKDTDDQDEEKCIFLKKNPAGQMRCSIYETRPEICREYSEQECSLWDPFKKS
jgi:Fe-S-cluster containining protein